MPPDPPSGVTPKASQETAAPLQIPPFPNKSTWELCLCDPPFENPGYAPVMRLVPVFILETHNPDELQNIFPSSSRRIMRP